MDTYLSAAGKLKEYGHEERAKKLMQHASEVNTPIFEHIFTIDDIQYFIESSKVLKDYEAYTEYTGTSRYIDVIIRTKLKEIETSGEVFNLDFLISRGKFAGLTFKKNQHFKFSSREDAVKFKKFLLEKYPEYRGAISPIPINLLYK